MPRRGRWRSRAAQADTEETDSDYDPRHGEESSDTSEDGGEQARPDSGSSSGSETDSVDERSHKAQRKTQEAKKGRPAANAYGGAVEEEKVEEKEPELLVELSDEEGAASQDTRWALQEMEEDDVSSDDNDDNDGDGKIKPSGTDAGGDAPPQTPLPDVSVTRAEPSVGTMQSLLEADAFVGESQDEDEHDEEEEYELMSATPYEIQEAKWLVQSLTSHVSRVETLMIRQGLRPEGPPIQLPIAHSDEFARKFRWPQHLRNLRNVDFSQDASEILQDYELVSDASTQQAPDEEEEKPALATSAFAPVPRPMLATAAMSARQTFRKRKLAAAATQAEDSRNESLSAAELLNIARLGTRFGDRFLGSLLSVNARALQGLGESQEYDQRCWTPLPSSKKPIANWRFVMEHLRKRRKSSAASAASAASADVVCPPMKQATLMRIQDRLKQLYGLSWQPEDDEFFKPTAANNSVSNVASAGGSEQDVQVVEEGEEISF